MGGALPVQRCRLADLGLDEVVPCNVDPGTHHVQEGGKRGEVGASIQCERRAGVKPVCSLDPSAGWTDVLYENSAPIRCSSQVSQSVERLCLRVLEDHLVGSLCQALSLRVEGSGESLREVPRSLMSSLQNLGVKTEPLYVRTAEGSP